MYYYRKVASSRPVFCFILNSFGERLNSTYASNFPLINSLKILKYATNRDSLLLATLRYVFAAKNVTAFELKLFILSCTQGRHRY